MTKREKEILIDGKKKGISYTQMSEQTGLSITAIKSFFFRNKSRLDSENDEKTCLNCGVPITNTPHKREKKFCCDSCRMTWWKNHQGEITHKVSYTHTCANCGVSYENGKKSSLYCSRECYFSARRVTHNG